MRYDKKYLRFGIVLTCIAAALFVKYNDISSLGLVGMYWLLPFMSHTETWNRL